MATWTVGSPLISNVSTLKQVNQQVILYIHLSLCCNLLPLDHNHSNYNNSNSLLIVPGQSVLHPVTEVIVLKHKSDHSDLPVKKWSMVPQSPLDKI